MSELNRCVALWLGSTVTNSPLRQPDLVQHVVGSLDGDDYCDPALAPTRILCLGR
jgi:hypothetical protein